MSTIRVGPRRLTSDLLHWPSTAPVKVVLLFIAGNPGLPQWYTAFLERTCSKLPNVFVYAAGHLGHAQSSGGAVATLREQVQDKVDLVDELVTRHGIGKGSEVKLVLQGHSVGAWVCLEVRPPHFIIRSPGPQVLKQRPHLVSAVQCLFPTISDMRLTPNGRKFTALYGNYLFLPLRLTTTLLSYAPTALLHPLVGLLTAQKATAARVTTGLVTSPSIVENAISMAKEEMDQIQTLDKDLLRTFGDRLRFYWSKDSDDSWVLPSSVAEICAALEEAGCNSTRRTRCVEGMKHAFILDEELALLLADRCGDWLKQDFAL